MSDLTIKSDSVLGPLNVSIYPPAGEPVEFTLSSGQLEKSVPVGSGRYSVVARRPNGARIFRDILIGHSNETISLISGVGSAPDNSMLAETYRGQVVSGMALDSRVSVAFPGSVGEDFRASILAKNEGASRPVLRGFSTPTVSDISKALRDKSYNRLSLNMWRLGASGTWEAMAGDLAKGFVKKLACVNEFLKLEIDPAGEPLCLGLLDEIGFGPVVTVAPFAKPGSSESSIELTFLSTGIQVRAADRRETPGGRRVAVAFATPRNPVAADLLATLAAPAAEGAVAVWDQTVGNLTQYGVEAALDIFSQKFEFPAEAMLAAHYLLRFIPRGIPLHWVDNLAMRVLSDVADGPAIAAWAYVLNPERSSEEIDRKFGEYMEMALSRPVVLFARTRQLIAEARPLLARKDEPLDRWKKEETFRRFGADAGGLESSWGGGPASPGVGYPGQGSGLFQCLLVDGRFLP